MLRNSWHWATFWEKANLKIGCWGQLLTACAVAEHGLARLQHYGMSSCLPDNSEFCHPTLISGLMTVTQFSQMPSPHLSPQPHLTVASDHQALPRLCL